MKIQVNGEDHQLEGRKLADILTELGYGDATVATAVNGEFVAATERQNCMLNENDRLEIVAPMQGG